MAYLVGWMELWAAVASGLGADADPANLAGLLAPCSHHHPTPRFACSCRAFDGDPRTRDVRSWRLEPGRQPSVEPVVVLGGRGAGLSWPPLSAQSRRHAP